jgi:PAS domain S-box-containing protein
MNAGNGITEDRTSNTTWGKHAEEALLDSELRYRRLFETVQDAILILDGDTGKVIDANKFILDMLGFPLDYFIGKYLWELGFLKDKFFAQTAFMKLKSEGYIRYEDLPLETKLGRAINVEFVCNIYSIGDKNIIQCNIRDITEGKMFVEENRARLTAIENYSEDAIISKTLDGIITKWNAGAERIYGYSAQEIVGKNISILDPPDNPIATALIIERIKKGEPIIRYETVRRKKDGGLADISLTVSEIRDANTGLIGISSIAHDITKRKQIEDALRSSETRYRRLFETAHDGILILDFETGHIVDVNPFLINLLGYSHEQFLGKRMWEIGLFKDIVANKDNFEELQRKEYIRYDDLPLETADGRKIAVEFVSNVYKVNNKKVIQCNIRDITERKMMTDLVETSLAEKETLLREIHHRVKNNLQIISSLLNLQIRKTDDPTTVEVLKDCQARVLSMALVHEHLYKGKDFSFIDLKNYIPSLGTELLQSYRTTSESVRFDLNIPDISIDINTAIPVGLIINELITNSLKYAFKGRKDGKLSITANETHQVLTLIVADNGIGIPEGITLENPTSLGLRLVKTLTDQIDGTVAIDRTEGTKFVFTFPILAGQQTKRSE